MRGGRILMRTDWYEDAHGLVRGFPRTRILMLTDAHQIRTIPHGSAASLEALLMEREEAKPWMAAHCGKAADSDGRGGSDDDNDDDDDDDDLNMI